MTIDTTMTLTYVFHSCFVLETDKSILIFDYIFIWKEQHEDITYILSKDIYKHRRANKEDANVWLAKGGTWSDGTVSVWALGSTDCGVS